MIGRQMLLPQGGTRVLMNDNGFTLGHGGTHLSPIPWTAVPAKGLADLVYGWPLLGGR
jgi:hypothetical protein